MGDIIVKRHIVPRFSMVDSRVGCLACCSVSRCQLPQRRHDASFTGEKKLDRSNKNRVREGMHRGCHDRSCPL